MSLFTTEIVGSQAGKVLWRAGDGVALLYNTDPNNTVYLDDNPGVEAGNLNSSPLPSLSSIVVDGKKDIYGICLPSLSAQIGVVPGGLNFFNLARIITRTLIIDASKGNGLFVYSPFEAPGNLIAWITPGNVDPIGNETEPIIGVQNNATSTATFITANANIHFTVLATFTFDGLIGAEQENAGTVVWPGPNMAFNAPMQAGSSADVRLVLVGGNKEGTHGPYAILGPDQIGGVSGNYYSQSTVHYCPGTGVDDAASISALMALGFLNFNILPGAFTANTICQIVNDGTKIHGSGAKTIVSTGAGWVPGAGTNPVFDVRARDVEIAHMKFGAIDGWAIQHNNKTAGGGLQINHQPSYHDMWFENGCAGGLDLEGNGGNSIGAALSNLFFIDVGGGTAGNLDALRIQDAFDVFGTNVAPGTTNTTLGHGINLLGHCNDIRFTNVNCGGIGIIAGSGSNALNIQDTGGGTASEVYFINCIFQTYDHALVMPGASNSIHFIGCEFRASNFDNAQLTGTGFDVYLTDCTFTRGGQAGVAIPGTYYDLNASGTVHFEARGGNYASPIVASGAAAGVQFSVNIGARNRDQSFPDSRFTGAGSNSTNWFPAANLFPRYVKINGGSPGLAPRQPAIAASGTAVTNDTGFDCMVYIGNSGNLTGVSINGTAIPTLPLIVEVPANATITLTYGAVVPTWQWFAE